MTLAHVNGNNEKVFFPTKQHSKFEKNATDDYGQYYEESKNKNMFDPDNYPKNPRFSCKSVQNSNFKTSPIKESTKTEQRFSSYAQAYVPSYANGSPVKQQESANIRYDQPSWQQPEIKENSAYANLFENSCFQLLNEKLTAFTTGRFKRPQYKVSIYSTKTYSLGITTTLTQFMRILKQEAYLQAFLTLKTHMGDTTTTTVSQATVSIR